MGQGKLYVVKLTEPELRLLATHFSWDIEFGVNGTFGDGELYLNDRGTYSENTKRYERGKQVLEKLKKTLWTPSL